MKKINLMQNLFAMNFACATVLAFSAILASSALLTGCTGFTEDGNTSFEGGSIDVQTAFASARVTGMGKAHVDESKDSVTFVTEIFGGCFRKNGTLYYDADYYFEDVEHFAYNFRNDTLQLFGGIGYRISAAREDDLFAGALIDEQQPVQTDVAAILEINQCRIRPVFRKISITFLLLEGRKEPG